MITIPLAIWYSNCHLIAWPNDLRAALAEAHFSDTDIKDILDDEFEGMAMINERGEPVIIIRKEMRGAALMGVLAHEAFHAAQDLLADRGLGYHEDDNNEGHAYLINYLVEQSIIALDKAGKIGKMG